VQTVVSQVPLFAQECMDCGVTSFESKPVVLAARLCTTASGTLGASATSSEGGPTGINLEYGLCAAMDYHRLDQSFTDKSIIGLLPRLRSMWVHAMRPELWSGSIEIAGGSLGVLTKS